MKKHFTPKSVLLGLVGGLLISACAYPNDYLVRSNLFVGNHLPVALFFLLFVFCVCVRPLLTYLPPAFRFSNGELTVSVVIMLAACSLPTSSLMRYFPTMVTCPYDLLATRQHWQTHKALSYTPRRLVPEGWYVEGEDEALDATMKPAERLEKTRQAEHVNKGLRNGIVAGTKYVHFWPTAENDEVIPLRPWLPILWFWGPLIVCFLAMVLGITAVMHPQWSKNELLPYPIAEFTSAMIRTERGRLFPALFYRRTFWIGFGVAAGIHFIRCLFRWYPDTMINIPLEWRIGHVIGRKFPNFYYHGGDICYVFNSRVFLSVVAFAFFVPTDVSFSLGITALSMGVLTFVCWKSGTPYTGYNNGSLLFGAYAAMFVIILYLGRRYYLQVFRSAFGLRTADTVDAEVRWSARLFVGGFAGMVACCTLMGLSLPFAFGMVFLLLVLFVVVARITAETGDPFIQAHWYPMEIFSKLLGPIATGPRTLSVSTLISRVLAQDVRECLSSFWVNGLKMADTEGVPRFRLGWRVLVLMVPCTFVALLAAMWVNYNGRGSDSWGLTHPPRMTYDAVASAVSALKQEPGLLEKVVGMETREGLFSFEGLSFRLRNMSVEPGVLPWMVGGFLGVLACSFLRIRYTWWFVHPVLLLAWGNYATNMFASSFFCGFVVKLAVVKYGGGKMYQDMKPLFMGVIMGELAMGGAVLAFNVLYFLTVGVNPVRYHFLPG